MDKLSRIEKMRNKHVTVANNNRALDIIKKNDPASLVSSEIDVKQCKQFHKYKLITLFLQK